MIDSRTDGEGPSRAQLILVGSIVIAVVVIMMAIVMNSLLVTETNTPGRTTDRLDDTRKFDYETRRGVQSLVLRVNHRERNVTGPQLADNVSRNLGAYSQALAESYVNSQSAFVNVSYHNESSAYGYRLVQIEDGNVYKPNSLENGNWTATEYPRNVSWFTMNVNVTEMNIETSGEDRFFVNASNGTDWVNTSVNKTASGELTVESETPDGTTSMACDASQGRALVDFVEGETLTGACNFTGIGTLDGPVTVEYTNGRNVVGRYDLVVDDLRGTTLSYYDPCHNTNELPSEGCRSPAVWTANVTTTFESDRLSYTDSHNVSVYGS